MHAGRNASVHLLFSLSTSAASARTPQESFWIPHGLPAFPLAHLLVELFAQLLA